MCQTWAALGTCTQGTGGWQIGTFCPAARAPGCPCEGPGVQRCAGHLGGLLGAKLCCQPTQDCSEALTFHRIPHTQDWMSATQDQAGRDQTGQQGNVDHLFLAAAGSCRVWTQPGSRQPVAHCLREAVCAAGAAHVPRLLLGGALRDGVQDRALQPAVPSPLGTTDTTQPFRRGQTCCPPKGHSSRPALAAELVLWDSHSSSTLLRARCQRSAPVAEVGQVEVSQHHRRAQQRRAGVGDALARDVTPDVPGSLRSSHRCHPAIRTSRAPGQRLAAQQAAHVFIQVSRAVLLTAQKDAAPAQRWRPSRPR